jgi:hypothetical protein
MEHERKEPKRGSLESYFALASTKKQKVHDQSTLIDGECLHQSVDDDVLLSSTPKTPILLTITDYESTQQSKSTEALSSSSAQQLESTVTHSSPTPADISCSGTERPAQPKLSSYKKNKHNRSFQSHWYSIFSWIEYSEERDCAFCFYCRHFTS